MNRFRLFWSRCAGLFHRRRFEQELREELEFHFGAEVDHQMRNGLNRAEAERQARKKFGSVQQTKEACRDTLAFPAIDAFVRDLRHGLRGLAGDPGFTITAVLTLAIGIGVTTTLFSVFYGVLLRPLPWPDAEQLVRVEERRGGFPSTKSWTLINGTYNAWLEAQTTVQGVGGWRSSSQTLLGSGDPERVLVVGATPSLLRILEARPELGRLFTDEDSQPGQRGSAILSFGLWQDRFGGDTNVLGQTIQLDGITFDIVGIMPRGFAFPDRATRVWTPFRPLPMVSPDGRQISVIPVETIARLRPGVTPATVEAEVTRARTERWSELSRTRACVLRFHRGTECRGGATPGFVDCRQPSGACRVDVRRCLAVDRFHWKCRQHSARARDREVARYGRSAGHGRETVAPRPTVVGRKRVAGTLRRGCWYCLVWDAAPNPSCNIAG